MRKRTLFWQTISSKVLYESPWIRLHHNDVIQPDGNRGIYDVIEKKDFVLIIPQLEDEFILVNQYRYAVKARSWEFPEGSIEIDETPTKAAKRELAEETGFNANSIRKVGSLWTANGLSSQKFHVFIGTNLTPGKQVLEGSEQDMLVRKFKKTEIGNMIKDGIIKDGPTVAAFGLLLNLEIIP